MSGTVRRRAPHLGHERAVLRAGARLVAGMDEVGRGSLAGPVSVGVVVVDLATRTAPVGVADSKLLSPAARRALLPALGRWGRARAVGHASAAEIDEVGIITALRLAGTRALAVVEQQVGPVDAVLLDGSHDWLTPPADLFCTDEPVDRAVHLRVKADRECASVAAASVLAKCERDALMVELGAQFPQYGWAANKGYASAEHVAALGEHGPCPWHRRSWRLPGLPTTVDAVVAAGEVVAGDGVVPVDGAAPADGASTGDRVLAVDRTGPWGMMGR